MDVLAALGSAPTAVIAVVAIVLGVVLVARGKRGEPAAAFGTAGEVAPSPLTVPIAAAGPATDAAGLRTMAVGKVGHGAIRLGSVEPEAVAAPEAVAVPEAVAEPEAMAAPEAVAVPEAEAEPEAAAGGVPFRQGTIKLRQPSGD